MGVLQELVIEARECMCTAGLTETYIVRLGRVWKSLGEWLEANGLEYTPELADRFLAEEYGLTSENKSEWRAMDKERSRAIIVLRDRYEREPYHRADVGVYRKAFDEAHDSILTDFLDDLSKVRTQTTVNAYVFTLNKLSPFLAGRGVGDLRTLHARDMARFVEELAESGVSQHTVYSSVSRLRRLVAWLADQGYVGDELVEAVPRAKTPQSKLPDTYTDEEIGRMVDAIDTASPVGKRDLVACLLAARLGMRSSDIVGLKLENLRWRTNTIEFASRKTGRRTVLPLTNEIGEAIIDYLANGRPVSDSTNVLLRHTKPHTGMRPGRVHRIVTDALNDAGIAFGGRRHGPHALRASLATGMMASGVPLPTISATLSHANEDTTRIYLKVDVERLRACALEVPPLVNTWWMGAGRV